MNIQRLKFQNSYRLEARNPFNRDEVERILEKVMENHFSSVEKFDGTSVAMCRYKIIVVVTVCEKFMQGICYSNKNLWGEKDTLAKYVYDHPSFFAIATCYGIYFEMYSMDATLDDDKKKLENIWYSAKKFFYRYVLLMILLIGILLIYSITYYLCYIHEDEKFYYVKKLIGKGLYLSNATIPSINFLIIAIIFPVCRTFNTCIHKAFSKISPYLLAMYMEKLKVLHQILALSLIYISFIHIVLHFVNAINFIKNYDSDHTDINWSRGNDDNVFRLMFLTPVGFSGWTMFACLIIIWIFSSRQMRNYFYNSFMGVHHIFILFYIMLYYHPLSDIIKYQDNVRDSPPICDIYKRTNGSHEQEYVENYCRENPKFTAGKKNFWIWPTITIIVFLLDHLFRYFKRFFYPLKLIDIYVPTRNAIFLTFKINDNLKLRPGQYILLQCENISTIEWHPFFIVDFVVEPRKTVFSLALTIRGDWTNELYDKVYELKMYAEKSLKRKSNKNRRKHKTMPRKLNFIFDGPYSNHMESILSREHVVLIGQGIGIAPFISIFNYVLKTTQPTLALKRIHLVWIARDIKQFTLFLSTLCELTQMFWDENKPDKFEVRFYLISSKRQSIFMDDFYDEEVGYSSPEELFGENVEFIMSRIYIDSPNWNFLFNYYSSLYGSNPIYVYSCGSKSLNKDVRRTCCKYNKQQFNFRFIHEAFS